MMLKPTSVALALAALLLACGRPSLEPSAQAAEPQSPRPEILKVSAPASTGAKLLFADEFESLSLWNGQSGRWRTVFGYGGKADRTLNDEKQLYNLDRDNVRLNGDGTLSLVARRTDHPEALREGYAYSSGMINMAPWAGGPPHKGWQYGYFEMRADVPIEPGTWPAFWLLPAEKAWPPEIDIMEMVGSKPGEVVTTIHSTVAGEKGKGTFAGVEDGFHTFAVDWRKDFITWYVDDREIFRVETPSDMHRPMIILANLALGGGWAGPIDLGPDARAELRIDYIRVYDRKPR
jgi:hypothetical protein